MKSERKTSGGLRATTRRADKRLSQKGGDAALTTILLESDEEGGKTETDRKVVEGTGSALKVKLRSDKLVYVNGTEGKVRPLELITVAENKANRQFARNNIITKGAVVKAKDSNSEVFVRVTSRPGQQGTIQGIILGNFVKEKDLKAHEEGKMAKKQKKAAKKTKKHKKEAKEGK